MVELAGALFARQRDFLERRAIHEVIQSLVGFRLGREQEVGAAREHGFADRLAGEQIVAEIDGAQRLHARGVRREPALGGGALAILFLACFSAPSGLTMNSGIKGMTMLCPGATSVAASME